MRLRLSLAMAIHHFAQQFMPGLTALSEMQRYHTNNK